MKRRPMNRGSAARKFKRGVSRTKAINISPPAARGGYRL